MENLKYDFDQDLDETTCDAETLARLEAPANEQAMSLESWKVLYAKRVSEGYYEAKKAKEKLIKSDPRLKDLEFMDYINMYKVIEKEYEKVEFI